MTLLARISKYYYNILPYQNKCKENYNLYRKSNKSKKALLSSLSREGNIKHKSCTGLFKLPNKIMNEPVTLDSCSLYKKDIIYFNIEERLYVNVK